MSIKTKLAGLERRMGGGAGRFNCPACRRRPAEVVAMFDGEPEPPPSQAPRCPLCGNGPQRIVVTYQGIDSLDFQALENQVSKGSDVP